VPDAIYDAPASTTAMNPPDGADLLDAEYHPDPVVTAFGLDHTDSNQHVNSLVYPRLFAEAALRRLAELERPRRLLIRALDIAYRKPSFAGDRGAHPHPAVPPGRSPRRRRVRGRRRRSGGPAAGVRALRLRLISRRVVIACSHVKPLRARRGCLSQGMPDDGLALGQPPRGRRRARPWAQRPPSTGARHVTRPP
jgi:hypothetical protein